MNLSIYFKGVIRWSVIKAIIKTIMTPLVKISFQVIPVDSVSELNFTSVISLIVMKKEKENFIEWSSVK